MTTATHTQAPSSDPDAGCGPDCVLIDGNVPLLLRRGASPSLYRRGWTTSSSPTECRERCPLRPMPGGRLSSVGLAARLAAS